MSATAATAFNRTPPSNVKGDNSNRMTQQQVTQQQVTLKTNDEYNGMVGVVEKRWNRGDYSILVDGENEAKCFTTAEVIFPATPATEFGIGSLGNQAMREQEAHEETTAIIDNLDSYTRYQESRENSQTCKYCGANEIDGAMFTTMNNGICDDCQ